MKTTGFTRWLSLVVCTVLIAAMALGVSGCGDNTRTEDPAATMTTTTTITTTTTTTQDTPVRGEGATSFRFTVVDLAGQESAFVIRTNKTTVGEALLENGLIAGEDGAYGLYVKTVNGITADEANQEWWCLTKGGESVMTGVDQTPLEDGAAYEFTLTVGW